MKRPAVTTAHPMHSGEGGATGLPPIAWMLVTALRALINDIALTASFAVTSAMEARTSSRRSALGSRRNLASKRVTPDSEAASDGDLAEVATGRQPRANSANDPGVSTDRKMATASTNASRR